MPRSRISDVLQNHLFWAFDATASGGLPVFSPLFGFSAISAPKINVEVEDIPDGTSMFHKYVVRSASVSPITFERAATLFDSDFYDWVNVAIYGTQPETEGIVGKISGAISGIANKLLGASASRVRRNIMILQYTSINNPTIAAAVFFGLAASAGSVGVAAGLAGAGAANGAVHGALHIGTDGVGGAISGSVSSSAAPFFGGRIPARAWMLHNCIPISYTAASDFDAKSGEVSLVGLDVQPEYIEEFNCGIGVPLG